MPWAEKYRPRNLREFVDQRRALTEFLEWVRSWKPGTKALFFYGPPGTGKTALIEAYARESNLEFIQMNASDFRSARRIHQILGQSMQQAPLFKRGKILLIDEVDGLAGKEDAGGVGAVIRVIKESRFPVVLTANSPWDPRLRTLRSYCRLVEFRKIPVWDIERKLKQICEIEGISVDRNILRQLAKRSEGDLRSAINDLEIISAGKRRVHAKDLEYLGYREREANIFDALKTIFKTKNALAARLSIQQVNKDPDEIFWWIENNIAREFERPEEIARAFDALSRADLFRARVMKRQSYRFKAYMIDLMTAGVALSKKEAYRKFTKYQYPSKLIMLGRTKTERKEKKEKLLELSRRLHCSTKKIKTEFLPYLPFLLS